MAVSKQDPIHAVKYGQASARATDAARVSVVQFVCGANLLICAQISVESGTIGGRKINTVASIPDAASDATHISAAIYGAGIIAA